MITVAYIVLILGLLILEKFISESGRLYGLFFALFVIALGFALCAQLIWMGLLLVAVNILAALRMDLRLRRLTA